MFCCLPRRGWTTVTSREEDEKLGLQLVDLEKIVKEKAVLALDSKRKKVSDLKNPVIHWHEVRFNYGDVRYVNQGEPPKPTSRLLFATTYVNDTPTVKTYDLKTERSTTSSCEMNLTKTYTFGTEVKLGLSPVIKPIDLDIGFKSELSNQTGLSRKAEQTLTWGVDSEISVPSGTQTTAELLIYEDNYDGEFEMLTTFEGTVIVTYKNKRTKEFVGNVLLNIQTLLIDDQRFSKDDKGRPTFLVKGICKSRMGINQFIKITETKL
ncbi:uncharacterized protein LOC106068316 isoform X2 [Biomphalaria glabrata]|nr:uncharacterized protein LOC106068316 isoform X2 [Biomphalaria glabrata]XP_055885078.1 uncharacterized protein LOC106068316 isoform X2 [Biomphalaria glabrata]XP_055885079.1 uncharacterized protein LOC106068316 isoform X2 [Biomphalaria glabrata]XP_055885080.1 uncharacterized protein LOC106068316 isoform X2 [Biomphalaria glabrata]XP_055885081.1 uncharacterized protein LOC106068316 isoform X2 [Biomphalaria glabrata]KAI8786795.1 CAunnamed protein product [Biomphalaria glabrata]